MGNHYLGAPRREARHQNRRKPEAELLHTWVAVIPCYRCTTPFLSPDKRAVRHCDQCRGWLFEEEDYLPWLVRD